MVKKWCINCKMERDHTANGDNYQHLCSVCGRNTLANIVPDPNENQMEMVQQMIGETQRISRSTGQMGDIEVRRRINDYQTQILVYNTFGGLYSFNRQ